MKNLFKLSLLLLSFAVVFNSCKDDETNYDIPAVTAPSDETVLTGNEATLTFDFTAEAGFQSATAAASNGTATIATNGTSGSKSGSITVTYTAGASTGAGSVSITLTDSEGRTSTATAVMNVVEEEIEIDVADNISGDVTWETGKVYILTSRIAVLSGATLTIQPGVIVKGKAGTGPNATALLIARGATLMAEGTLTQPIIFTSVADEIMPGEIASPNMPADLNGLWGGLIMLGNAPISADEATVAIEGIPPSDANGLYGGEDPTDNSGIIRYVSIRHGGSNIGEGNEINGLTLGGVGSGTVIENVEIVANQDDGIEWFGGTVNVTNALVWNPGDDAIDADQDWTGTLDNFIVVNPGDEGFELDGPEGTPNMGGYTIKHGSIMVGDAEGLVDNDANTEVVMDSIYFFNLGEVANGQDFDEIPTVSTFTNFEVTLPDGTPAPTVADYFKDGSDAFTTAVAAGAATVGADKTVFADWTWFSLWEDDEGSSIFDEF